MLIIGVDSKLAYFTHTYVRGFVATRPLYSDVYHCLCLSFMFTFVLFSRQLNTSFSALMEYRREFR